jgi:hypothetical protein
MQVLSEVRVTGPIVHAEGFQSASVLQMIPFRRTFGQNDTCKLSRGVTVWPVYGHVRHDCYQASCSTYMVGVRSGSTVSDQVLEYAWDNIRFGNEVRLDFFRLYTVINIVFWKSSTRQH